MSGKTTVSGLMLLVAAVAVAVVVLLASSLLIVTPTITVQAQQSQTNQTNQTKAMDGLNAVVQPIKLKTFENPILGYSIQYPQNWSLKPFNAQTDLLYLNGTTNILVVILVGSHAPTPGLTINDYFNILTGKERGDTNSSFISSTVINPPQVYQPAVKIMKYDIGGNMPYKEMVVWIPDDNAAKLFAIRYSARPANFTTFLPVVNEMVKSFRPIQVR